VSIYRVTGSRAYQGYQPGETFEAILAPMVEDRALRRRNIELVERSTPRLVEGSYSLPTPRREAQCLRS
jgi:hypothetical protein